MVHIIFMKAIIYGAADIQCIQNPSDIYRVINNQIFIFNYF